ncbi:nitroreductase family protein [Streptomyces sp. NPDC003036]|uniref:nitroreductase family protein n=1 Tax=Streptomyces sp. NPDC003036 TaxID=3154442 RepID=UPI0033BC205A
MAKEVRDHYSRSLDGNGGHASTPALLDALAATAVHVTGRSAVASAIAVDLRTCGVRAAAAGPLDGVTATALTRTERHLVVVVEDAGDPECPARTAELCGPLGIPVLRVAASSTWFEIGPFFLTGFTACPDCLNKGRVDAGWSSGEPGQPAADVTLAGLVASEVFALLTGATAPAMIGITRISQDDWTTEQHVVVPRPGCPCDDTGGGGPEPDPVDVHLRAVDHAAPAVLQGGPPPRSARERWAELGRKRPAFHAYPSRTLTGERLRLPGVFGETTAPAPGPTRASAPTPRSPDLALVADLLARTAGRRGSPGDGAWQRWAPTGGQLGSVEIHLLTDAGVPGLPGSVFRYDDVAHALIALRADPMPMASILAGTDLRVDELEAALVFTAAHGRVAAKYRDFAYRLTHLDAGCAATQLDAVARAHGLSVRFATSWDASPAEHLDLTDDQYVTAIAGLLRGETCP